MAKAKNEWRSFHIRLSRVASGKDYARIDALYRFLDAKFKELLSDPTFLDCALANIGEYRTRFVKAMNASYGKPYLSWPVNNAAKHYRIMMTQVRDVMRGFVKRQAIARVCERFDWDCGGDRAREIQKRVHDETGEWVRFRDIANICRAGEMPSMPEISAFELDYSSEDDQVCETQDRATDHVHYALRVDDAKDRALLMVDVPRSAREHRDHYAKPNIIPVIEDGLIVDYEVMVSYEPVIGQPTPGSKGVLGVDLGKLKAASMVAIYPDGSVSREHLATKETQLVLSKLNHVHAETVN